MNYEEMSDFDINVRVAESIGLNWYCAAGDSHTGGWEYCSVKELMNNDDSKLKDYCNNPFDAWPIIVANRINVYASEGPDFMPWMVGRDGFMASNKNPLRAAMIVFLMMQDEAK